MTKTARRATLAAATLAAIVGGAVVAPTALAHDDKGLLAIGLTADGHTLVAFDTAAPEKAEPIGDVTLVEGDSLLPLPKGGPVKLTLVGIDFRPANGKLYGVGDGGEIYILDPTTAEATPVGVLSEAGEGEFVGVDFNPAADALRIVTDSGQNLRQPFANPGGPVQDGPNGATVADADLNYDGDVALGISGAGYTNNDNDADTATQLFDIDTKRDQLALQNPPNAGTLTAVGSPFGDIGPDAGFDIYSTLKDGETVDNDAFAIVQKGDKRKLIAVDFSNGNVDPRGAFEKDVADLAILLDQK